MSPFVSPFDIAVPSHDTTYLSHVGSLLQVSIRVRTCLLLLPQSHPTVSPHLQRGGCSCRNRWGLSGHKAGLWPQDLQFNKCLLSTYYMVGITLEVGNNDWNKNLLSELRVKERPASGVTRRGLLSVLVLGRCLSNDRDLSTTHDVWMLTDLSVVTVYSFI